MFNNKTFVHKSEHLFKIFQYRAYRSNEFLSIMTKDWILLGGPEGAEVEMCYGIAHGALWRMDNITETPGSHRHIHFWI